MKQCKYFSNVGLLFCHQENSQFCLTIWCEEDWAIYIGRNVLVKIVNFGHDTIQLTLLKYASVTRTLEKKAGVIWILASSVKLLTAPRESFQSSAIILECNKMRKYLHTQNGSRSPTAVHMDTHKQTPSYANISVHGQSTTILTRVDFRLIHHYT